MNITWAVMDVGDEKDEDFDSLSFFFLFLSGNKRLGAV
jgi:hypothetical protein